MLFCIFEATLKTYYQRNKYLFRAECAPSVTLSAEWPRPFRTPGQEEAAEGGALWEVPGWGAAWGQGWRGPGRRVQGREPPLSMRPFCSTRKSVRRELAPHGPAGGRHRGPRCVGAAATSSLSCSGLGALGAKEPEACGAAGVPMACSPRGTPPPAYIQ